jgi:hypothetical protein
MLEKPLTWTKEMELFHRDAKVYWH